MSSLTARAETLRDRCDKIRAEEELLREGGGKAGQERQHKLGRLVARERIARLLDHDAKFFEIGLWAAHKMYEQWGRVPAAGAVAGIGNVANVPCMIVANDATVKAGAFFPQTVKKLIRAQRIAFENNLPLFTWSIPPAYFCRCRMKFFQMRTTSGSSFEIIRSSPRPAFRNSPPSWAIASPAAPICRCCATRS